MKYDPTIHHRRSIRLKGYNYRQPGAYFITLVTHDNQHLFGEVLDGIMCLSTAGKIVERVWQQLPQHYPTVRLDSFCVMPDHVHAIIQLQPAEGGEKAASLGEIVRALKTFSAKSINEWRHQAGQLVWQRNYYEHIIRDVCEWESIQVYIAENSARWEEESEFKM